MALSRHYSTATRPLTIQEIVRQAQDFDFSTERPLRSWLRSGKMLLIEAAICEHEGNLQQAYLYLYRHADLVIAKLPTHPEVKDPRFKYELSEARKTVQKNLLKLESMKPRLDSQYQRYARAMERREAEKRRIAAEHRDDEADFDFDGYTKRLSVGSDEGALEDRQQSLNAGEHRELAIDLAHREIQRRDASRLTTRQAGISPDTTASRRKGVVIGTPEVERAMQGDGTDELSQGIREIGRRLEHKGQRSDVNTQNGQSYHYPSVPGKSSRRDSLEWDKPALIPRQAETYTRPPDRPAKELQHDAPPRYNSSAPPLPSKSPGSPTSAITTPAAASSSPPAAVSKYTFKPAAYTESGTPLRTLFLPPNLREDFMNLAHANTTRNLETCAILCGTLVSNALFISHLILPEQHSTSDTCDTTEAGDNALFDYCDANELLVCGWIHTHPTQTCFLSSRDLHTSSGYQVMLPEAIAIVCAPRQTPDWGVFRLTDPPGLKAVLGCRQTGLFHPHAESSLYTDALRPGHVVEAPGLKFEVVDLRG